MTVLSTKKLQPNQREILLHFGLNFVEYNAITTTPIPFELPEVITNMIITSQQAASIIVAAPVTVSHYFVVGSKTEAFLTKNGQNVIKIAKNGAELAHFIAKSHKNTSFYYGCGNLRRNELPTILKTAGITLHEVELYTTTLNSKMFQQDFDGVLFYSPSGVAAFAKANTLSQTIAFCIGETTAGEARKHTAQVVVANDTTVESIIAKAVKMLKSN